MDVCSLTKKAPLAGAAVRTCGVCPHVRLKRPVDPMDVCSLTKEPLRVGIRAYRKSASITSLTIGAATFPPKPPGWFSTTAATATCGWFAGANAMNQAV